MLRKEDIDAAAEEAARAYADHVETLWQDLSPETRADSLIWRKKEN